MFLILSLKESVSFKSEEWGRKGESEVATETKREVLKLSFAGAVGYKGKMNTK